MLNNQQGILKTAKNHTLKCHFMALSPLALIAILSILNAILPALLLSLSQHSFSDALLSGFGQSFIIWFSLFVCFQLYFKAQGQEPVTSLFPQWQYILAFVLSLGLILPFSLSSWLCAAVASLSWQFSIPAKQGKTTLKYTAILLLALAIREPSAQFFLQIMAEQVLALDAQLAYLLLALFSDQVSLQNNIIVNNQGTNLIILTGCSAFGNLSLAMLLYLSLKLFWFEKLERSDFYYLLLLVLLVLLSNSSRLALMTLSNESYTFIHDGIGADAFDLVILLIPFAVLLIPSYLGRKE